MCWQLCLLASPRNKTNNNNHSHCVSFFCKKKKQNEEKSKKVVVSFFLFFAEPLHDGSLGEEAVRRIRLSTNNRSGAPLEGRERQTSAHANRGGMRKRRQSIIYLLFCLLYYGLFPLGINKIYAWCLKQRQRRRRRCHGGGGGGEGQVVTTAHGPGSLSISPTYVGHPQELCSPWVVFRYNDKHNSKLYNMDFLLLIWYYPDIKTSSRQKKKKKKEKVVRLDSSVPWFLQSSMSKRPQKGNSVVTWRQPRCKATITRVG